MSLVRGAAVAVVIAAALAGCSSNSSPRAVESNSASAGTDVETSTDPTSDEPDDGSLDWSDCPEEDTPSVGDVECATLTVPLDYENPEGEQIDLSLVRVPAGDDREGAVLTNPGGPGGSGVDMVVNAGPTMQTEMGLGDFDIVGFDPRGVDRSGGISCVSNEAQDKYLYVDPTPDDPAEQQLLDESKTAFTDACRQEYGDDLVHYSTANTARDMDEIRKALGDEQITFLGISYGTYLGAVYATMFPDQVRAMVLDSAYEPTGDTIEQQYLTQLVGFEGAFNNWTEWCVGEETCGFRAADAASVGARWDALHADLDLAPLDSGGRTVNNSTLMTATVGSLYSESSWPDLAGALVQAESGDGSGILRIADLYEQRNADGTFATIGQSGPVIRCASGIGDGQPPDPQALLLEMRAQAPRFARDTTLDDLRDHCPELIGSSVTPPSLQYDGDGPILVVGGTNDPATPFRWAEELTALMGGNAVLVTYTGEGHGQLLTAECITDLEGEALADAEVPDEPQTCEPDPPIAKPDWWDGLPVPEGVSDTVQIPALTAALGLTPTLAYSEMRLTDLAADDVRSAYRAALESDGFTHLVEQEALPDVSTDAYTPPQFGTGFIVLTLPPEAFENDELANLADVVPEGKTVVVLAAVDF